MYKIIFRRSLEACLTLFMATLIIFLLTYFAPGDPIELLLNNHAEIALTNTEAYQEKVASLRAEWGLDQNLIVQYVSWIKQLLQLDLGNSLHTGRLISVEIAERLPATIALSVVSLILQIVLGMLLGIVSALHSGRWLDHLIRVICAVFSSLPGFVIGLVSLSLFAVMFNIYEISNDASLSRIWLPAVILGVISAPQLIRVVRASMLSEFGKLYVASALSRGLVSKHLVRHVLRNCWLPVITVIALSLTSLISGAVVIETIFSWPGIGKYALDSILVKDYAVIKGYAFIMVALVIIINLIIDLLYTLVDPRLNRKGAVIFEKSE
ncbi:ABC transporter permease [Paenibacillus solani]|uniref:ABC transporter permease n=1 Tax=Paenibacillus solani TaxID=1705565 RepID=UPI003D28D7FB